jgi:tetratricopeptide (TPR) repeat protein
MRVGNVKYLRIFLLASIFLTTSSITYAKIPEAVLAKKSAVVSIYIEDKGKIVAGGSGFIIDPNGVIVTNAHVIEPWSKSTTGILYVKKSDESFLEPTEIIAMDSVKDVALIRVKEQYLPFIKLTSDLVHSQGDDVIVIGNPLGLETTVTNGIISAIRGEDGFLQISAPISQGSSGSPVLNSKGEAIGVATLIMTGGQNLNFAIPASYVSNLETQKKTTQAKGLKRSAVESIDEAPPAAPAPVPAVVIPPLGNAGHRGRVLFTTNTGGYTYIKYDEGGKEAWVAVVETTVNVGDFIEFPDSEPLIDFESKTLNMKFDKLIFAPGIRLVSRDKNSFKSVEEEQLFYVNGYLGVNDVDGAINALNLAIESTPNNSNLYYKRAEIFRSQIQGYVDGENGADEIKEKNKELCAASLDDVSKAIYLNNKIDYFYATRAEILTDEVFCTYDNKNGAVSDYENAIRLNPKKYDYHKKLGWLYLNLNNLPKALERAKSAISLNPKDENAHYLYGKYYFESNNYPKALEYYKKGLSLSGKFTIGNYYVDELFEKYTKYTEAVKMYTDLIKQNKDKVVFYFDRANYNYKLKKYKNAISDYSVAIKANPNSGLYYYLRGFSYYSDNNKQDAMKDFQKACELTNESACEIIPVLEAELKRGDNWVLAATSNSVSYYYDKATLSKSKNGVLSFWVRGEVSDKEAYISTQNLEDYEKIKFKDVSHEMSRFNVDCQNQKFSVTQSHIYAENGNVIQSFENDKNKFSNVIPGTIGSGIYEKVCTAGKTTKSSSK